MLGGHLDKKSGPESVSMLDKSPTLPKMKVRSIAVSPTRSPSALRAASLAVGERLPPHREIARALGINVTTVTRALSTLQQRGLLEARPGRGTTVAAAQTGERPGFNLGAERRSRHHRSFGQPAADLGLSRCARGPAAAPAQGPALRRVAGLSSAGRAAVGARGGGRLVRWPSPATATPAASS